MSGSAKRVCVQCGTEFPADAPWCPKCGLVERITVKLKAPCAKCRADLLKDAVFCIECGTKQERRLDASLTRLESSVSQLTETVSELNEQVPKIGHVRVERVELFECSD
jgi:ribosomal protein L40E